MKFLEGLILPSIAPTTHSQSCRVLVAGLLDGGSEDKPSVQLFVVEDSCVPETTPLAVNRVEVGLFLLSYQRRM